MPKFTANLSVLFTELDLIDRFKAAKDSGFTAIEIQFPYSLTTQQIKQQCEDHQLKLVLFNIDADDLLSGGEGLAGVPEKHPLFLQALEQCHHYAEQLQPEVINVLPSRCFDMSRKNDYFDTFHKNLNLALEIFAPLGIKTVFEAINSIDMPNFMIDTAQQMLTIVNDFNHPLLLMQYDIYHRHMMNETMIPFIQQNADKIGHIQFADVPYRGQPSTGIIDFKTLFKVIDDSTYQGWLGAEYNPIGETCHSLDWLRCYSTPSS